MDNENGIRNRATHLLLWLKSASEAGPWTSVEGHRLAAGLLIAASPAGCAGCRPKSAR